MKLNKREKNLAIGVGIAAVLTIVILFWQLGFAGEASLPELQARYTDLSAKVDTKSKALEKAKHAALKLDEWQRRSLPTDVKIGSAAYKNWLLDTVNKAGFHGTTIEDGAAHVRGIEIHHSCASHLAAVDAFSF